MHACMRAHGRKGGILTIYDMRVLHALRFVNMLSYIVSYRLCVSYPWLSYAARIMTRFV